MRFPSGLKETTRSPGSLGPLAPLEVPDHHERSSAEVGLTAVHAKGRRSG